MLRTLFTLSLFGLLAFSTAWAQIPLAGAPFQPPNRTPGKAFSPLTTCHWPTISPCSGKSPHAAEAGARDYLAAFARRCGRPLTPAELRRAMADGDGDPALMALIRANHLGDTAGREQLAGQIRCPGKATR
jgi:hypothetical protein